MKKTSQLWFWLIFWIGFSIKSISVWINEVFYFPSVEERFWDFFQAWMHRWILVRSRFAICFCIRKNNLINYYHPIFTFFHCCDNKYFFLSLVDWLLKWFRPAQEYFQELFQELLLLNRNSKQKSTLVDLWIFLSLCKKVSQIQ